MTKFLLKLLTFVFQKFSGLCKNVQKYGDITNLISGFTFKKA